MKRVVPDIERSSASVVNLVLCCCLVLIAGTGGAKATAGSSDMTMRNRDMSIVLSAGSVRMTVRDDGMVTSLFSVLHKRECLALDQPSPLLAVKISGRMIPPTSMLYDVTTRLLRLEYKDAGTTATIKATEKKGYLVLELKSIEPLGRIDAVVWGPYATTITKTAGEIVGVVRDDDLALGLLSLNVKTVGGYPLNDEGVDPSRGRAAERKEWGSVLQSYSLDRSRPRRIAVWNGQWPDMPVPPIAGETVVGSKIALFGCPPREALSRIGTIEVAEGLPHPLVNGIWQKVSPETGRSYLIADYSEDNIDELLGYTKRANLMTLYHMQPFVSWGHFEINPQYFPHGIEGVRKCVEKANALGIRLGAHVLTNFVQTNDPYVTPNPDPRLMRTGTSSLTREIDSNAVEIAVASPEYFVNEKANWLHTVVIGHELVRYHSISDSAPWQLLGCERGEFGTQKSAHSKGEEVGKLADHPYKVFFPNIDLQNEIAANLARRFNQTGWSQMDFDGREGCWASGEGDYAEDLFTKVFYDNLDHTVINGTSTSSHFYWHINSYCNWGEPWYGGFKESMQEYRIGNQALFERNYLPNMLGWYLLTKTTSPAEMEWMLARAAGYNAGFAVATNLDALRGNAQTGTLLDEIREWENARRSGAFSKDQRDKLKDPKNEFHLERAGEREWSLYPYHRSLDFTFTQTHDSSRTGIGGDCIYSNGDSRQPLRFVLKVAGDTGTIVNPSFVVDKREKLEIPTELTTGQSLVFDGSAPVRQYDSLGHQLRTVEVKSKIPLISKGRHAIHFSTDCREGKSVSVVVTFRSLGKSEIVRKGKR